MKFRDSAPANIALIKYMGKSDYTANKGANPSLSFTLENLRTFVELETINSEDCWAPLEDAPEISVKAQNRFLDFFKLLKREMGISKNFIVKSKNNFPSDAGIASSASSFAALTKTTAMAAQEICGKQFTSLELARLSRQGSGSSCRSLFGPWCAWDGEDKIHSVTSALPALCDLVFVVETRAKEISSSDAHKKVLTSPLFQGRTKRAQERMHLSLEYVKNGDWNALAKLAWAEFWDMHSLFHTAQEPFFYFKPGTIAALEWAEQFWKKNNRGPIVTIDAGPNVHFLVPVAEKDFYLEELNKINNFGAKIFVSL